MANKKTRAVTQGEFNQIVDTIQTGFTLATGEKVKPGNKATIMVIILQANLGLRVGDIIQLKLSDIVFEGGRYHLDIIEEKTGKARTFTVPTEVYTYLQSYALEQGIRPSAKLFPVAVRTVQHSVKQACEYLGLTGIGTHSFRKFFAVSIYNNNGFNVELVRELLQHSSVSVTQHYLSVEPSIVRAALEKHIVLPA